MKKLLTVLIALMLATSLNGIATAKTLFEAETGFTETNIKEMREKIQGIGIDAGSTDIIILNLANSLDELVTYKHGSRIYRRLLESKGGATFGLRLIEIMEKGQKIGAVNVLVTTFAAQQGRASKILLARLFNVPVGVLEGLAELSVAASDPNEIELDSKTESDFSKHIRALNDLKKNGQR